MKLGVSRACICPVAKNTFFPGQTDLIQRVNVYSECDLFNVPCDFRRVSHVKVVVILTYKLKSDIFRII